MQTFKRKNVIRECFFEICKRERGFFRFFLENPEDQEREGYTGKSGARRLYRMSGFNPDAMDKVFAALTCGAPDKERPASDAGEKRKGQKKGAKERGERKESRSRNSRAQDTGGDYSATEMPGTGHRGRLFGNRDAGHRTPGVTIRQQRCRTQDPKGDYSATEMPNTGHRGDYSATEMPGTACQKQKCKIIATRG